MKKLKPNDGRAKAAIILIWIILGLEVLSLISSYMQLNLLGYADTDLMYFLDNVNANDLRELTIGWTYTAVFIVSAVTFILWFRRAYYNLHQKVSYLEYEDGWAAGSWFIPILNLFRPITIMVELYNYTQEYLEKNGITLKEKLRKGNLALWWSLWILNNIMGQIIFRYSRSAESVEDFMTSTKIEMIGSTIGIFLCLITVKVISDYAKVEPLLFEVQEEGEMLNDEFEIGSSTALLDD